MVRLVSLLAILVLGAPAFGAVQPTAPGKEIVAYVFPQNNELQPGQIDASSLTRINYAFANIANGRIVTGFAKDRENYAFLVALKQQNPSLTVLVSVGGWLWSTNFSDVSLTRQSRAVFIQSVMEFLDEYKLDGLDIDWEYPGLPGAGHPFRREDKRNFTLLLKELRARFNKETARTHKRLYLTFAAGASDESLQNTEMAKAQRYVDTVNLMAYDYYEADSDAITGNHAPLFTDPADPKKASADASVIAFEKAGVPAHKILLGMPFYGRTWGEVADTNHGLFQPGKPVPHAYGGYAAIAQTMLNQGYIRYWDSSASVPYLYNAQKQIFVSYEDPQSIAAKCSYVSSHKLGGVMFWEYSGDPSGTLLRSINESLHPQSAGNPQSTGVPHPARSTVPQ
ncbi:MAG: glycoside hydrolase family 18 protein [Terracidiphilus sp.]